MANTLSQDRSGALTQRAQRVLWGKRDKNGGGGRRWSGSRLGRCRRCSKCPTRHYFRTRWTPPLPSKIHPRPLERWLPSLVQTSDTLQSEDRTYLSHCSLTFSVSANFKSALSSSAMVAPTRPSLSPTYYQWRPLASQTGRSPPLAYASIVPPQPHGTPRSIFCSRPQRMPYFLSRFLTEQHRVFTPYSTPSYPLVYSYQWKFHPERTSMEWHGKYSRLLVNSPHSSHSTYAWKNIISLPSVPPSTAHDHHVLAHSFGCMGAREPSHSHAYRSIILFGFRTCGWQTRRNAADWFRGVAEDGLQRMAWHYSLHPCRRCTTICSGCFSMMLHR